MKSQESRPDHVPVIQSSLFILFISLVLFTAFASGNTDGSAQTSKYLTSSQAIKEFKNRGDSSLILPHVIEGYKFHGLAFYYNNLIFYVITHGEIKSLAPGQRITLSSDDWFAVVGRFKVLLIRSPNTTINIGEQEFKIEHSDIRSKKMEVWISTKPELKNINKQLDQLRYSHLWKPLSLLARLVEATLIKIRELGGFGWGLSIVLFTVFLKVLLLPLSILATKSQQQTNKYQALLAPKLAAIKAANINGEEAHNRLMAAHKELGISPFYGLKPMLVSMLQFPVWIAVFNALGEMPQLVSSSFLWIDDLAYPDVIGYLPMSVIMFDNKISLLPILMTVVTILSTHLFQNQNLSSSEAGKQKRNLYVMAAVFFILFYPFPAAMVMYWTLSIMLQIVQQQVIKI